MGRRSDPLWGPTWVEAFLLGLGGLTVIGPVGYHVLEWLQWTPVVTGRRSLPPTEIMVAGIGALLLLIWLRLGALVGEIHNASWVIRAVLDDPDNPGDVSPGAIPALRRTLGLDDRRSGG